MTSMPSAKNSRAMACVSPKPCAAFSPLATTRSSASPAFRAGSSWAMASRPGLPMTSPIKRMCMPSLNTGSRHGFRKIVVTRHPSVERLDRLHGRAAVLAGRRLAVAAGLGVPRPLYHLLDSVLRLAVAKRSRAPRIQSRFARTERSIELGQGLHGDDPHGLESVARVDGVGRQALADLAC